MVSEINQLDTNDNVQDKFDPKPMSDWNKLELRDVSFTYPDGCVALRDVNIQVFKGEKVCFLGKSGSGKTTIMMLLLGLLEPTKGQILIDGQPLSDPSVKKGWQATIGFVPQGLFMAFYGLLGTIMACYLWALIKVDYGSGFNRFDKQKGMKLDKFSWDWFGEARTVTVEKEKTTIVDGKGNVDAIESRVEELQKQIEKAETPFEIEKLQERLAKFVGGVAIIHVGGNTETEMKEKKDRVDDALHATKAAIEEGIVPGGGTALLYASSGLEVKSTGAAIVKAACAKPFNQILVNAGYDEVKGQILADGMVNSGNDGWLGYDIKTDNTVDMKEAGIIDPTKVVRLALENAASVAGTVLLTECTVVNEIDEENNQPQIDPSMMGMM